MAHGGPVNRNPGKQHPSEPILDALIARLRSQKNTKAIGDQAAFELERLRKGRDQLGSHEVFGDLAGWGRAAGLLPWALPPLELYAPSTRFYAVNGDLFGRGRRPKLRTHPPPPVGV